MTGYIPVIILALFLAISILLLKDFGIYLLKWWRKDENIQLPPSSIYTRVCIWLARIVAAGFLLRIPLVHSESSLSKASYFYGLVLLGTLALYAFIFLVAAIDLLKRRDARGGQPLLMTVMIIFVAIYLYVFFDVVGPSGIEAVPIAS